MDVYRRFRRWLENEGCTVRINKPRMRIRGRVHHLPPRPYFVAFLGIPYARPPVDHLRFEPPEPLPQVPYYRRAPLFKAYYDPEPCIQFCGSNIIGSEDCLKLNIYTPRKPKNIEEPLPVFVYFHGGAFERGSGNVGHGILPDNIMMEKLIFVTVNYRLGVAGFLNMRSENCRGNAGLKDQVMALRWIKDNIAHFKGDPGNVTIAGQSAGGSAVNFHMISPLSRGLFHKAIVMAGGIHCPWGYKGHAKELKLLFKKKLRMENEIRFMVVESLKGESALVLMKHCRKIMREIFRLEPNKMAVFFGPSVECISDDAFLPETLENLMATAEPVPTISGITKQEGYMYIRARNIIDFVQMVKEPAEFVEFLCQNFRWRKATAEKHLQALKDIYFPALDSMEDAEIKENLATLITDIFFRRFYDNFKIGNPSLLENEWPPFYVYEFDYFPGTPQCMPPIMDDGQPLIEPRASEHGDDLIYLLYPDFLKNTFKRVPSEKLVKVRKQMKNVEKNWRNLFGSFCRDGVPKSRQTGENHVNWLSHTEQRPCYLHIGETLTLRRRHLNEERWSQLNAVCRQAREVPSLMSSPKTPENYGRSINPMPEDIWTWFT